MSKSPRIKSNQTIAVIEPVETDAHMRRTRINAALRTEEISEIL
jgi:hypothetical protein